MTLKFEECAGLVKRGRNGQKKLENNTHLHQIDENTFGVKLHNTDVVLIHSDGTYTLNTGGYETLTTKSRINEYAPTRIFQHKRIWYLDDNVVFKNGCRVDQKGNLIGEVDTHLEKMQEKLHKMIDEYIKGFVAEIEAGQIESPGAGDCMICYMQFSDDVDHLFLHMEEGYYVPSLLMNAIKERNQDYQVDDPNRIRNSWYAIVHYKNTQSARTFLWSFFKKREEKMLAALEEQEKTHAS